MKKIIVTTWVALVLALGFGVSAAQACSTPPPKPPITVQLHEMCFPIDDPTDCMLRGWITFHNYTSFGSSSGTFCACGFAKVGKIKDILWVKFVDPKTGERFPAWAFDENAGITNNAGEILGADASIEGFLAETCESITSGTNLDLMLEVVLEGDASIASIANALNNSGPILVTGEASAQGNFIGHVATVPSAKSKCRVQSKMTAYLGDAPEILLSRGDESVDMKALQDCDAAIIDPDGIQLKPQPAG